MPLTDMTQDELESYRPARTEPPDFDEFWERTLTETRARRWPARFRDVTTPLVTVTVSDVEFAGYQGEPVRGWLLRPAGHAGPLPCVVEFPGYGGGRGLPYESLLFSAAGYAHFFVDVRGQGATWRTGSTPDPHGSDPHVPGFMTLGVLDPETYYYRRVMTDAVQAVAAARSHPAVDADRIAVLGGSQGGGLALATAGLVPDLAAVLADVPFLCHFRRACQIASEGPYLEVARYLHTHRHHVDRVLDTLDYFDGVNFASRATAPARISAALMDPVCPPSTVYAAHHHYAGEKELGVWRFNAHESGQGFEDEARLDFLRRHLR